MDEQRVDPSFALITGVPFLMMSMLLFWAGLFGFKGYLDIFTVITPQAYHIIKIIFSSVVILFSIITVRSGWLTEGMVFMFIGVSSLSTSISAGLRLAEVEQLDVIYGLMIMACSVFMFRRKAIFRALASLFVGLALSIHYLVPLNIELFGPSLLVLSGILYFLYFGYVMYHTDDDKSFVSERDKKGEKEGYVNDIYEMVVIVGCISIGLLFLFDGCALVAGLEIGKTSIIVSMMMISFVATAIAIYASMKGELAEAVLIMMVSISYLFTSMSLIGGFETAPVAVEFITSLVIFPTMLSFYKRKNIILFVIATLAFIQGVFMVFMNIDFHFVSWYMIIEGALCSYLAVSVWMIVELKREILPVFDGYSREQT